MGYGYPFQQDLGQVGQYQATQQQIQDAISGVDSGTASNVSQIAEAHPYMDAGTATALGSSGLGPHDPATVAVGQSIIKKKGNGGFWGDIGHVMGDVEHVAADAFGAVKPIVREATTIASAPLQAISGGLRDVAGAAGDIGAGAASGALIGGALGSGIFSLPGAAIGGVVGGIGGAFAQEKGVKIQSKGFVNPLAQTDLYQQVTGKGLGEGYFAGGDAHKAAVQAQMDAASIAGHAFTPGRFFADTVARPGTLPYNVFSGLIDAAFTKLDPTQELAGQTSKALEDSHAILGGQQSTLIGKVLAHAGLLADGTADTNRLDKWLTTSNIVSHVSDAVTKMDSASKIRELFGNKISSELANTLKDATTGQQVQDALRGEILKGSITSDKVLRMNGQTWLGDTLQSWKSGGAFGRLGADVPGGKIDLGGAFLANGTKTPAFDSGIDQFKNWMLAGRLDDATITQQLDKAMASNSGTDFKNVVQGTVDDFMRPKLSDMGWSKSQIDRVLGETKASDTALKNAVVDEISKGHNVTATGLPDDRFIGYEPGGLKPLPQPNRLLPLAKPNYLQEMTDSLVDLPDWKTLRGMTTPNEGMRALYNSPLWDSTTGMLDKAQQAWKGLTVTRPATLLRMMVRDLTHASAAGLNVTTSPSGLLSMLIHGKGAEELPSNAPDMLEEMLQRSSQRVSLSNQLRGAANNNSHFLGEVQTVVPGDEGYVRSWLEHLIKANRDPLANRIAATDVHTGLHDFWRGDLTPERERLAAELGMEMDFPAASYYVHDTVNSHIDGITAGDPRIRQAIADGFFTAEDGKQIPLAALTNSGITNPDAERYLQNLMKDPNFQPPPQIIGRKLIPNDKQGVRTLFHRLGQVGKEKLIQNSAYNQFYWKNAEDMMPLLSREDQAKLLDIAQSDRGQRWADVAALKRRAAESYGSVSMKEASDAAHWKTMDNMMNTFVTLATKKQWQDAARFVSPFASVWQKEVDQWSRFATEHPESLRRAQLAIQGAAGSSFMTKDENGNYALMFPGFGNVAQALTGVPFGAQGQAASLAPFNQSILPAFGPMMSIAASKLIPNKPGLDKFKKLFAPYGDPTQGGVTGAFEPSWMKALGEWRADPNTDPQFGNLVSETMRYLYSTGNYSMGTVEGQQKLLDDATRRARSLALLQAFNKFVSPAAPSLVPLGKDAQGNVHTALELSKDYQRMEDPSQQFELNGKSQNGNPNTATSNFLEKYGEHALMFIQGNTYAATPAAGLEETDKAYAWGRDNPQAKRDMPNTWAFFAPPGGVQDYTAYLKSIQYGDRKDLTPTQVQHLTNDKIGSMLYYNAKDTLPKRANSVHQAQLAQYKAQLENSLPGFGDAKAGLPQKANSKTLMDEMQYAVDNNPDNVMGTAVGQALKSYMDARSQIMGILKTAGVKGGWKSTKAVGYAQALTDYGNQLARYVPGFNLLFDRVLSTELPRLNQPEIANANASAPGTVPA